MNPWPWLKIWLLWTAATATGISLGLMLPTADPLLPFTPIAIAALTGLLQALVLSHLRLIWHPWLWVVVTSAGGCINFLLAFLLVNAATLGAVLSGMALGALQSLLLYASPQRRLRWMSTLVLWAIVTTISYGLAAFWVISHQGVGGSNPSVGVGLGAGVVAGALKGAILATLVTNNNNLSVK